LICNNKSQKHQTICEGCLSILYKPQNSCQNCGNEIQNHHSQKSNKFICGHCQLSAPYYSHTYYACSYQSPIDKWVMALKFGHKVILSRLFAELMSNAIKSVDESYVLMPVPLHKIRLKKRGYNQAYEIAKEITKFSFRNIDTTLLRQKNTAMQAQLKLNQRAKNVSKAFVLKTELIHKKIILIDDVMTSGNTLNECAKTLIKAGAEDVRVLVFARKSMQ
jgi:ComF family protein